MVGVSKLAVSALICEAKKEDPNYALMRDRGALNVAKDGSDVFQYASCIRILNLIQEYQSSLSEDRNILFATFACVV